MRDDLLDAQAAVDWAIAQIPVLQERFVSWQRSGPYELVTEPDADAAYQLLVARQNTPIDPLIGAEAGAIINAMRSALDLLAASLAARNCVKPSRETHFPIYKTAAGFADPMHGIDSQKTKKWLSAAEIAAIKSLRPYNGGDAILHAVNELDVLRKHERLISVYPDIARSWISWVGAGIQPVLRYKDDKTILYRLPAIPVFRPTPGNCYVAAEIFFNEPALGIRREPVTPTLRTFACRIADVIRVFD